MKKTSILAIAFALTGTVALAQSATETLVKSLQDQGYTNIEVKDRAGTVKVEGYKEGEKVEVTIDKSTGEVLKRETDSADGSGAGSDDGTGHDAGDDHGGGEGGDDHGGGEGGDDHGGGEGGDDHGGGEGGGDHGGGEGGGDHGDGDGGGDHGGGEGGGDGSNG